MLSRSDVSAALSQLAGRHGLPGLELDDHDSASIEFGDDGAIIFEYQEAEGSLTMWAPLCALDIAETAEDERRLLKSLLALNFPGSRLSGARVALNPETGVVLLARGADFPPGQPEVLSTLAQNFAVSVESILGQLKDGSLFAGDDEELKLQSAPGPESFIRA